MGVILIEYHGAEDLRFDSRNPQWLNLLKPPMMSIG